MSNLDIYEKSRNVPEEAQKAIQGGRLKGMTDIKPMWRIKKLTELFGPCGIGWYTEILKQWVEQGSNNEQVAFCNINLYIKHDNEWSKPIPGTGGSSFVSKEKNGMYTSDECFKMAYTDAISVACKSLGVGADVYWQEDKSKYGKKTEQPTAPTQAPVRNAESKQSGETLSETQVKQLYDIAKKAGYADDAVPAITQKMYNRTPEQLTKPMYDNICLKLKEKQK